MMKIDPGAIGFTSGFSQDSISITMGEQITVEQLIKKMQSYDNIQGNDYEI